LKRILFKQVIPLALAFIGATIFFISYNHYLLDKSLANVKISLKRLEKIESVEEAKKIKAILEDILFAELAEDSLDAVLLAKIEFSGSMIDKFAMKKQAEDIKYILKDVIREKEENRRAVLLGIENFIVNIFPRHRKDDEKSLQRQIGEISKRLFQFKGEELQKKHVDLARIYLRLKDLNNAFYYFNKAIEIDPETPRARKAAMYLGIIYKYTGDYEKAKEKLDAIKGKLPKKLEYYSAYQSGDILSMMGKQKESIKLFEDLFEKDPKDSVCQLSQFRVGYYYLYELDDIGKAYKAFLKLQQLAPNSSLDYYIGTKIIPDLSQEYRKRGYEFLLQAYRYLKEGKYGEALEQFNLAVSVNPDDALSLSGRGLALYFLNRDEESLREASKAKEIDPRDPEVLENLGYIYYNIGAIEEALKEQRKAVKLHPNSFLSHYNLGTIYLSAEEPERAKDHLERSIKLNPDFAYSYNNLGYAFWNKKNYNDAKTQFKKAVKLKPDYVEARYNLGVVLFMTGDFEDAKREFKHVKNIRPDFKSADWYLKEINKKLGYED